MIQYSLLTSAVHYPSCYFSIVMQKVHIIGSNIHMKILLSRGPLSISLREIYNTTYHFIHHSQSRAWSRDLLPPILSLTDNSEGFWKYYSFVYCMVVYVIMQDGPTLLIIHLMPCLLMKRPCYSILN